jgi:hypothetical protein
MAGQVPTSSTSLFAREKEGRIWSLMPLSVISERRGCHEWLEGFLCPDSMPQPLATLLGQP